MSLAQLQFGGVFNCDNPLVAGNEPGQHVQKSCLAGAGSTRNDNVQPRLHASFEQLQHAFGERQVPQQIRGLQGIASEAANREQRAVYSERRYHRINARSVGKPGIYHRRGFVNAPPDAGDHALYDAHEVSVIFKLDVRLFELAAPFYVDQARSRDQNIGDGWIPEQRLNWPQAENFVEDLLHEAVFLGQTQRRFLFVHQLGDRGPDLLPDFISRHGIDSYEIDSIEQFAMDRKLQLLILQRRRVAGSSRGPGRFDAR